MTLLDFSSTAKALLLRKHVFVSFSGGADSLALLLAAHDFCRKNRRPIQAVHFHHGIRGNDADNDVKYCRSFCKNKNINFQIITLNIPQNRAPGESDETAARRLRLNAWKSILQADSAENDSVILLGHHADDRAETLLMRLFRGSNVSGLTTLREVQEINGMLFLRPLLDYSKSELEEYVRSCGLDLWCLDRTNQESVYKRNFLRNEILPPIYQTFSYARKGIRQSIRVLEQDAEFLEELAQQQYHLALPDAIQRADHWAQNIPNALKPRVLRLWIRERNGIDYVPDHHVLERFESLLTIQSPEPAYLEFHDLRQTLCVQNRQLFWLPSDRTNDDMPDAFWDWEKEAEFPFHSFVFNAELVHFQDITKKETELFLDAAQAPEQFLLSVPRNGESMIPFGGHTPKSLKKIFSDAHRTAREKKETPVLRLPDRTPVWIPGVRRSSLMVCGNPDSPVLKISMRLVEKQR